VFSSRPPGVEWPGEILRQATGFLGGVHTTPRPMADRTELLAQVAWPGMQRPPMGRVTRLQKQGDRIHGHDRAPKPGG